MQAIVEMKCSCSAEEKRLRVHVDGMSSLASGPNSTLGWLVLGRCLHAGSKTQYTSFATLHKLHRRKQWPWSARSFLPHGPSATIQGLVQWCRCDSTAYNRSAVFASLNSLIEILRPLVIPHLIVSRAFLDSSCFLMQRSKHSIVANDEEPEDILDVAMEQAQLILTHHRLVFTLTNEIERKVFHAQMPTKLLLAYASAFAILIHAVGVISERKLREPLQSSASHRLLSMSSMVTTADGFMPILMHQLRLDTTSPIAMMETNTNPNSQYLDLNGPDAVPPQALIDLVRKQLQLRQSSERCTAPTCIASIVDGRLKLCMGCQSVQYCSRRCQKRAWNNLEVGHRTLCGMLVAIPNMDAATASTEDMETISYVMSHLKQIMLLKLKALSPAIDIQTQSDLSNEVFLYAWSRLQTGSVADSESEVQEKEG
jgi:hypothetical protein